LSETNLLIRSVPLDLPQLNLPDLFSEIEKRPVIDEDDLFERVIACQSFSVYAVHEQEKRELLDFIQQQNFPKPYCKHLDQECCLDMMTDA
jgi:DNA mismatch repair protein MutL